MHTSRKFTCSQHIHRNFQYNTRVPIALLTVQRFLHKWLLKNPCFQAGKNYFFLSYLTSAMVKYLLYVKYFSCTHGNCRCRTLGDESSVSMVCARAPRKAQTRDSLLVPPRSEGCHNYAGMYDVTTWRTNIKCCSQLPDKISRLE